MYQLLLCCVVGYISNYECHKFAPKSKPPCIINTSLRQQNTQPLENCSLAYSRNQRALILFGGGGGSKSFKTPPPREARTSEQLGGKKKHKKKRKIYQYANQQETRQQFVISAQGKIREYKETERRRKGGRGRKKERREHFWKLQEMKRRKQNKARTMKGCARVWFCYQKHNEKRGFDCCSLLRVKKHPEDAGPSLAHNIKRLRISGAHKWAMAQESTKLSAPFLVAQMVFGFSSSSSSSLVFPLPHPGPQAPSSCARSHSRCANPGVAFLQGPIQVYKSPNVVLFQVPI